MNRKRPAKPIIIQTTDEMANWMHPQTPERKKRIKDRTRAAIERLKNIKRDMPDQHL